MVKKAQAEKIVAEELVDNMVSETSDEKAFTTDWEEYVRSEIKGLLDALLPVSVSGNVGIIYKNLIMEELESGPVYDDTKAIGVDVVLSFDFGQEIIKPV